MCKRRVLSEHTVHHPRQEKTEAICIHILKKLAAFNPNQQTGITLKGNGTAPFWAMQSTCEKKRGREAFSTRLRM